MPPLAQSASAPADDDFLQSDSDKLVFVRLRWVCRLFSVLPSDWWNKKLVTSDYAPLSLSFEARHGEIVLLRCCSFFAAGKTTMMTFRNRKRANWSWLGSVGFQISTIIPRLSFDDASGHTTTAPPVFFFRMFRLALLTVPPVFPSWWCSFASEWACKNGLYSFFIGWVPRRPPQMPGMPGLKPSEERRERHLPWPPHTLLVPIVNLGSRTIMRSVGFPLKDR